MESALCFILNVETSYVMEAVAEGLHGITVTAVWGKVEKSRIIDYFTTSMKFE